MGNIQYSLIYTERSFRPTTQEKPLWILLDFIYPFLYDVSLNIFYNLI